ncbi:MAG TPA: heat-inducible transcriptional repressor HrcA [Propionicimonas sp.]|nr:heat-inducible transcriptional repressor HrcA [Propionicimonas sp.]HQA77710.1 heat-inducible transcriptional repressor HrcA [Propionicimonas sp.]HQD96002.1 heat-inducible transcriptional repressor HrcA [Propionicimonas sp.]
MLDDRKLRILRAIVTDYVSMREPIGSRALVERYQLDVSPATVRNDMAVLEEEGYITQPHTSAGRIPTDKGYRLFVDRLGAVKPLSSAERRAIETFMDGALDVDEVVRRTVRLLAQITQQVAIVQYPVLGAATIRHVEIVALTPERGVLIVVNSSGRVEQHPVELGGQSEAAVADLRGRLNACLSGLAPAQAIERTSTLLDELPADLRPLGTVVIAALLELISSDPTTRVVVGGVPNLTRFSDQYETTVRPVLEALEEQVVLLRLLGEATAAGDVSVRIGHENSYAPLRSTSVVASAYGANPDAWATLGVVGPTRMDYPSTMAAVRAVARYVGRFLEG